VTKKKVRKTQKNTQEEEEEGRERQPIIHSRHRLSSAHKTRAAATRKREVRRIWR